MKKILFILLLYHSNILAQQYNYVTHLSGSRDINGTNVSVKKIGSPTTGGGLCGINDYWIGYAANNGYEFAFSKPVNKLRIRFTAVNRAEEISFTINGQSYQLRDNEILPYSGSCYGYSTSIAENGKLTTKEHVSNAEVTIDYPDGIREISIQHINGKKWGAGVVFDIAIVEDIKTIADVPTSIENLDADKKLIIYPNPFTSIVNVSFLPSLPNENIEISIIDVLGRKKIIGSYNADNIQLQNYHFNLSYLIPGNYNVELLHGQERHTFKVTKL